MAWITPKTDWTTADGVDYADLNRIEGNHVALQTGTKEHVLFTSTGETIIARDSGNISTGALTLTSTDTSFSIITDSLSGSDDRTINIVGGGSSPDPTRGAYLSIHGDDSANGNAYMQSGVSGDVILQHTNDKSVLIGTTSGSDKLRVANNASGIFNTYLNNTNVNGHGLAIVASSGKSFSLRILDYNSNPLFRVLGDGTTLIATSTDNTIDKLQVNGSAAFIGVKSDTISEKTGAAGVTIDSVLLKDNTVTATTLTANTSVITDTISEKTGAAGVTIDGVLLKDSIVYTDTISEKTGGSGVTIDSVLLKDNTATAATLTANTSVITDTINEKTGSAGISFGHTVKWKKYYKASSVLESAIFTAISSWVTTTGTKLACIGQYNAAGITAYSIQAIAKETSTSIRVTVLNMGNGSIGYINITSTGTTTYASFEIMSNFDAVP